MLFISYANEDREISEKLEAKLKTSGLIVHRDKSALRFGDNWKDVIFAKVKECDVFILLWSRHSSQATPVMEEIVQAVNNGRQVYPILLDDKTPLPGFLKDTHYILLKDLEEQFDELLNNLNIEIETVPDTIAKDIKNAISTYKSIVKKRFGALRVLFLGQEKAIEDAYVELTLMPGLALDANVRAGISPQKIFELLEISEDNYIISGHPGTGKTSTFYFLMHWWTKANSSLLPIYARLKEFEPKFHKDFQEFVLESFYSIQSLDSRRIFESINLFNDCNCVLLLDGLDEVAVGNYEILKEKFEQFLNEYRHCRIIITTRIGGFKDKREQDFLDWNIFSIAPLSQDKIREFISLWFNEPKKEEKLLSKIRSPLLFELAGRAFLLALMCLVFDEDGDIGPNRSALYEQSILYLEKSRLKRTSAKILEARRSILKEIALRFLQLDSKELDEHLLEAIIVGAIPNGNLVKNPKDFLEELVTDTGLLQNYGGSYGFIHKSFQEYYAALALRDMVNGKDLLLGYCQVPQWEEPLRLYAGSLSNRREQEKFIDEVWHRNPALALRTATECHQLAPTFLGKLISESSPENRLRMIETVRTSLNTIDVDQARRTVIETLNPLFQCETDSAVLYFGIQLLKKFDPEDSGEILSRTFYRNSNALFNELASSSKYKFEFVEIPAGSFIMGDDNSIDEIERQEHPVHLSSFKIAKYQLTNLVYEKIMGNSFSKRCESSKDDDQPVVNLNWYEAYVCALRVGCRLPTEAEWEYAARAGSTGKWCFGDDESELPKYANYEDSGINKTWQVGSGKPNEWGLCDIHGNVWEWCQDWLAPYTPKAQTDPKGPRFGTARVRRGGGHAYHARGCRCGFRWGNDPSYSFRDIGVRLAQNIEKSSDS